MIEVELEWNKLNFKVSFSANNINGILHGYTFSNAVEEIYTIPYILNNYEL